MGPEDEGDLGGTAADAASPTGQRYIHHAARGWRVLLFVREQRKQDGHPGGPTEPFVCLGFARYEGHKGERPMAIRCGDAMHQPGLPHGFPSRRLRLWRALGPVLSR